MIEATLAHLAKVAEALRASRAVDPARCKHCGSTLYITEAVTEIPYVAGGFATIGQPLPTRERAVLVAACTGCEFVAELEGGAL